MDYKNEIALLLMHEIDRHAQGTEEVALTDLEAWLEMPPDLVMGDYAFPCFKLAKIFRKSPLHIAQEMAINLNEKKSGFLREILSLNG